MMLTIGGKAQRCCQVILALISVSLIGATLVPLVHTNAWWIRVFDFPRVQIAILLALTLAAYAGLHLWHRLQGWEYGFVLIVGLALIWQLTRIAPYTSLYPEQLPGSDDEGNSDQLSMLVFNVRFDNRKVAPLLDLIRKTNPDIVLLAEPTLWWREQLDELEEAYPYAIHQPQENRYGMLLYSRLELINPEVRFLIEPEIPSIRTQVRLRSGTRVVLYGVHPRPPGLKVPEEGLGTESDDEREDSDKRDAELLLIAKEVRKLGEIPAVVGGDFNDVAWSRTTQLFQETGGFLDPRMGRGLYNTFDTRSILLRFPLDHAFATRHFRLVELRRLPDIGSDHFPLLVTFDYAPEARLEDRVPNLGQGDLEEVDEAIREEITD